MLQNKNNNEDLSQSSLEDQESFNSDSYFRDIIVLVDAEGNISYQDSSMAAVFPDKNEIINIKNLFPTFTEDIKNFSPANFQIYNNKNLILLTSKNNNIFARCYNLENMNGIKGQYLICVQNPNSVKFISDILTGKPKEYFASFMKEQIRQFIKFSNDLNSFLLMLRSEFRLNTPLLGDAISYLRKHTEYIKNFYWQQNKFFQTLGYENSLVYSNYINLLELLDSAKRYASKTRIFIHARYKLKNIMVRGEKNWLEYTIKNILNFIETCFPEIDPLKVSVFEKLDRNQISIEFDFNNISHEKIGLFADNQISEISNMFYNCYKIVDMNRGHLKFNDYHKILRLTLPMFDANLGSDRIIVLVVDDDWQSRKRAIDVLSSISQKITKFEASDAQTALQVAAEVEPDIILVDPYFDKENSKIKTFIESFYLNISSLKPEIILFSNFVKVFNELSDIQDIFKITFLRKEITDVELRMYLNQAVENAQNLKLLSDMAQNARRTSEIDSLTGAFNRSFYDQLIKREIKKAAENNLYLGLIIADIDHFKHYNDKHGHLAGDHLLKSIASTLIEKVRATDYVARYGGEEFAIVLINVTSESIISIAKKLREEIENKNFKYKETQPGFTLTASFGTSCYPIDGNTPDEIFKAADKRLYDAKNNGRNRVN